METLTEQAFGPSPPPPRPPCATEMCSLYMFPVILVIALVDRRPPPGGRVRPAMVSYLFCKCLEYHELFNANPRIRNGMLAINAVVVVLCIGIVCRSVHDEATKRARDG